MDDVFDVFTVIGDTINDAGQIPENSSQATQDNTEENSYNKDVIDDISSLFS